MVGMKGITIKLPEAVTEQFKERRRQSGRRIPAIVRERIETPARNREAVLRDQR